MNRSSSATASGKGFLKTISRWDGKHGKTVQIYDSGPGYTPGPRITTYFTMNGSPAWPNHNPSLSQVAMGYHAGSLQFARLRTWSWHRVDGVITWRLRFTPGSYWASIKAPEVVSFSFSRKGRPLAASEKARSVANHPFLKEQMRRYVGSPIPAHG